MFSTGEDEHLIYPQKLSSGDNFFVCASGENNAVGLIHANTDSEDTTEAYITDEDVVDTMRYDILEVKE